MHLTASRCSAKLARLLGSASILTMANVLADRDRAYAAEAMLAQDVAQDIPGEIPENVLITGSLIRGTVAVGVPVVNLSPMDFATTGALTTADLFKNFPAANIMSGDIGTATGARIDRGQKVNLRNLDSPDATRALMMVDGLRTPPSGNGVCAIDPSIIPAIALDHIDILVDGASATYGSDAVTGVVNVILKRNYDGAQTQLRYTYRKGGGPRYAASQLWGRTWDGGQITLSYEWYNEIPVKGNTVHGLGLDHSRWGYDDRTPIGSSLPGTISRGGGPSSNNATLGGTNQQLGTGCGYFNVPASGIASTPSLCYSIPLGTGQDFRSDLNGGLGPLTPGSASTLNWTSFSQDPAYAGPLTPTAGARNQFNPYARGWYSAFEERNGSALTIDQRLTKDISFYGSGYYSNRRSQFIQPSLGNPEANNALALIAVPTTNPYYPAGTLVGQPGCTGAAANAATSTCVPTNLRVSYDMGIENPGKVVAYELADRYQVGLNVALPAAWEAQIFYSQTYDSNRDVAYGSVNKSAVSAALGWTIPATPAQGTAPAISSWTKPTSIPYLNLFCDPQVFQCNSSNTLNYLNGSRINTEKWWINEKGIKADGPLFDLPGGTVKMAIGADITNHRFSYLNMDNTTAGNLTVTPVQDALHQGVWAVFTQVNIPVFGDNNAMFGFRRLELEVSWRHDQYDTVGGTSNPKVSFNWTPLEDFTLKGAWGSNFRAPGFGETSYIAKAVIQGRNLGTLQSGQASLNSCPKVGDPLPGASSGAGKLQVAASNFSNAMAAAGVAGYAATPGCVGALTIPDPVGLTPTAAPVAGQPFINAAGNYVNSAGQVFTSFADPGATGSGANSLLQPGGFGTLGGNTVASPIRQLTGYGLNLTPELATSWSIGFDYSPTNNFLRGLDIQGTYYIVKITNVIRGFGGAGQLTDALYRNAQFPMAFPSPKDAGCPDLPNAQRPAIPIPANLVPSACPQWVAAMSAVLANPKATVQSAAAPSVFFFNDGSDFNQGWLRLDGIDWNISYDWDMGSLGAFNVGVIGSYYLHQKSDISPSSYLGYSAPQEILDGYHTTTGSGNAEAHGVSTVPFMRYRARLGWSDGPWNVTGFMDYQSHYYSNQSAPPNVNGSCVFSGSSIGGGTFPCAQENYTNLQPAWTSFDLSIGYDTGEDPANNYLKNIGIQFVVQNILDKHPPYKYNLNPNPCSCDNNAPAFGRQISLIVTKTW